MHYLANSRGARIMAGCLLLVIGLSFAHLSMAAVNLEETLQGAGEGIYGDGNVPGSDSMPAIVGSVIRVVLSILGIMLVIIVVYAGFLWMTAGGDPEQVKKAKSWLSNAIIGLVILLAAYSITYFVIDRIGGAVLGP